MNALALYRLTAVPEPEKTFEKQPIKKQRISVPSIQSVKYLCKKCLKPVFLTSEDLVYCNHCQYRIVQKIPSLTQKTYEAV